MERIRDLSKHTELSFPWFLFYLTPPIQSILPTILPHSILNSKHLLLLFTSLVQDIALQYYYYSLPTSILNLATNKSAHNTPLLKTVQRLFRHLG